MKVLLLDLTQQYAKIAAEVQSAIERVCRSQHFILGAEVKQLEQRLSEVAQTGNYMETRRVGEEHASLEKALRALYDEWAARGS